MVIQHRRWILETRIARLNAKRDKLEGAYERVLKQLHESINEGSYSSNMMSEIEFLFPKIVSDEFLKFINEPNKDELKMKHGYYLIAIAITKSLKAIEDQVDALVIGKNA